MSEEQILAIADTIRVAYLRGTRDPYKQNTIETVQELTASLVERLEE